MPDLGDMMLHEIETVQDHALFNFSPRAGLAVAVMVGFLVFAVALDLTWGQFRGFSRTLKHLASDSRPSTSSCRPPPSASAYRWRRRASRSACYSRPAVPPGALSNYLTAVARGSVATSVSMTAISTLCSIVVTPLLFAFWAAMNPETRAVIERIEIDPKRMIIVLLIMLIIPVTAGMIIRARIPLTADRIRLWVRGLAGLVFATVVAILLLGNISVLGSFASIALPPVLVIFGVAVVLGWALARASGLVAADRRAVTLEVAFQNVALAIGLAVAFCPQPVGVAITSILLGVVHLTVGFAIAALWMRRPDPDNPQVAR